MKTLDEMDELIHRYINIITSTETSAGDEIWLNKSINPEPRDDGYETSADVMLGVGNIGQPCPDSVIKCEPHEIKREPLDDPYSFVDDEPIPGGVRPVPLPSMPHVGYPDMGIPTENGNLMPVPRKRGRKKKIKIEPGQEFNPALVGMTPTPIIKERKKHDRFNGMPEEEVSKRTLPDHLTQNLDIIIIGINPGLFAAYKGHHYAGPGNHFWKCLYLSGLTPEQMSADEDYKLLQVGIGFTNMVQRATKGSADLTRKEIKEGSQILLEKLRRFKPKIAVFNGKLIYEVFSGKKDFSFGRQPDLVEGTNTYMWVMPSSSARCAQLPRAADKVPFYAALKKFRDYLNGMVATIDDSEVVFSDAKLKPCYESELKSECPSDLMDISNATVKREDNGIFGKKKRGRPKKIKIEGEEPVRTPTVRRTTNHNNNPDGTKKKRGRPKKIKTEDRPLEPVIISEQTDSSATIRDHFSSPSPVQSPVNFCHARQMTPPGNGSTGAYSTNLGGIAPQPVTYAQSPRPQSQPFTHSDLSSEISAAISSDHLGSPAPTSPSLGPPDFDPPTSMPTDDTAECCFSSPAPSTASEHPPPAAYPPYTGFAPVAGERTEYRAPDVASKSLSGLESLVDQIPSIADGDATLAGAADAGDAHAYAGYGAGSAPYTYGYAPAAPFGFAGAGYSSGGYLGGAFVEHRGCPQVPVPLPYHAYGQQYAGGYAPQSLHMPAADYPYYDSAYGPAAQPAPSTGYRRMFDRTKPDPGYGGF